MARRPPPHGLGEPPDPWFEPVERIVHELAALSVRGLARDDAGRVEIDGGAAAGRRARLPGRVLRAHTCHMTRQRMIAATGLSSAPRLAFGIQAALLQRPANAATSS